ncbi:condensation domain-containing protein [Actinoplanes philippinensis]|uniref:condensation domain-containing protein n=1 Tax=Actinoplanes philippinensis TaxID=35752 RepID=UPI0033CCB2DA
MSVPTRSRTTAGGNAHPAPPAVTDTLHDTIVEIVREVIDARSADIPPDVALTAIGVTSLQLGQICARLGDRLGRPVPLSQMFTSRTVRSLAAWLARTEAGTPSPQSPAEPDTATTALTGMPAFMFMKHVFKPDDLSLHCVRSWRIEGRPDRRALRAAVAHLHERHPHLSAVYKFKQVPYAEPSGLPAPRLVEFLVDTEDQAHELLAAELARPFRLVQGDVWRAVFVALRSAPVTLFGFAVHHVAFDGGSAGLMAGDFARAYNAARRDEPLELPPAPTLSQVAAARTGPLPYVDLPGQLDYWAKALAGIHMLTFPGGAESPKGAPSRMLDRPLPDGTVAGVRRLASAHQVSPFSVYLSAYAQAMAELTGDHDFGVGTVVNRRSNSTLGDTVGCVINIVCLRPRPDPSSPPADAIDSTARAVTEAFAAQDVSAPEVVELHRNPAAGDRNALWQTMFLLQDNNPGELPLDGLPTRFFRPHYPGVASEVYAEVWPAADGSARLVVAYHPDRVSGEFCSRLADAFATRVAGYLRGLP